MTFVIFDTFYPKYVRIHSEIRAAFLDAHEIDSYKIPIDCTNSCEIHYFKHIKILRNVNKRLVMFNGKQLTTDLRYICAFNLPQRNR